MNYDYAPRIRFDICDTEPPASGPNKPVAFLEANFEDTVEALSLIDIACNAIFAEWKI